MICAADGCSWYAETVPQSAISRISLAARVRGSRCELDGAASTPTFFWVRGGWPECPAEPDERFDYQVSQLARSQSAAL